MCGADTALTTKHKHLINKPLTQTEKKMLTQEIRNYIDKSILCWLATSSIENQPNVSPKEIFTTFGDNSIIIANIASPKRILNILKNEKVCISFIDILVQKGFQIHGKAEIINNQNSLFTILEKDLLKMTEGKFPFKTIIKIDIDNTKPIIAPKYILYPETTEKEQIENAKKTYKLNN